MRKEQYITRKEASVMLGVSTRTLDRYVRKNEIRTKKEGRLVLVLSDDVVRLKKGSFIDQEVFTHTPIGDSVDITTNSTDQTFLIQKLFDEYRTQIEKKEEKIELLNYKLGQIEMKLKSSVVPLLEHKKASQGLEKKAQQQEILIHSLLKKSQLLSVIKNIYLIILLVLIVGAPFVWFLFFNH